MVEAARAVGAHDFIKRLPEGYDTVLHERGQNLSLGQRQLIAFARAVLADPRILILDEATANVDTRTEVVIQRALKRLLKGRTSFVIAHRLSTVRGADRVVVLDERPHRGGGHARRAPGPRRPLRPPLPHDLRGQARRRRRPASRPARRAAAARGLGGGRAGSH